MYIVPFKICSALKKVRKNLYLYGVKSKKRHNHFRNCLATQTVTYHVPDHKLLQLIRQILWLLIMNLLLKIFHMFF